MRSKRIFAVLLLAASLFFAATPVSARGHRHHGRSHDYTNVEGRRVHRPVHASTVPAGATAECYDGTYSFSQNHRGTCSHHGGVRRWFR
jgi:hypothetical protein